MGCEPLKEMTEDNVPASVELQLIYDLMKGGGYSESDGIMKGIKLCIKHLININK